MKSKVKKIIVMLFIVTTMTALFTFKANALSLDYSGSSTSNDTGAVASTSGYTITYDDAKDNICGYRFSVVTSGGVPKSGTKTVNIFLSNLDMGTTAYSSGQRFIVSSGTVANKKQLANGTKVTSSKTTQSCDYKSGSCGFYSAMAQSPSSIGTWIKNSKNSYQNLQRIYAVCGTNLSNATESDYVLIEPIFWVKLANVRTAATTTELAIYGAAVSGGDGYKGTNGNLYNAGSGTLWNLSNYINHEFPNALYVSSDTVVYDAVTITTTDKYTYKQIIQNGYGCSVLTVKNVVTIKQVKIAYHPNGGTASKVELNDSGFMLYENKTYAHIIKHGNSDDPFNDTTFGLTKAGYQFAGWKVKSTGKILDQDTKYASTVYAHYNDASKTTANTDIVYCYLYAQWTPNTVKLAYNVNGGSLSSATYAVNKNGYISDGSTLYFHKINHGTSDDPYNASTFELTKSGYKFVGWKVKSTGTILDQATEYASTVYAQHDDKSKTTANTKTVTCYLQAVWEIKTYTNSITHWASGFKGNGNNGNKTAYKIDTTTFTQKYADTYNLTEDYATTVPNGFYLRDYFGNTSITGTWAKYSYDYEITQKAKAMTFEYGYNPIEYNITYELNGGTNNSNNPTTYNVLYEKTLNYPTKVGFQFLGWTRKVEKESVSLSASTNTHTYATLLNDIEPGTEYTVSIGNAKVTAGSSAQFGCYIYDFTAAKTLAKETLNFGSDIEFTITCPATADTKNNIRIIVYSGIPGSTSGIATNYTNVEIDYAIEVINKGCDSVFSSADELYSELKKRTTGDITVIANWEENNRIAVVPIEPNAAYREKTEVVTSFWLVNLNDNDYTPAKEAKITYSVYNQNGEQLLEENKNFVCPKNDKNLSFFTWYIPEGYGYKTLIVKAHILEGTEEYSHIEQAFEIEPFTICKTPDTNYTDKTPADFSVPVISENENLGAKWWQWEYVDGTFIKNEYAVGNSVDNVSISAPNSPTAYTEDGNFFIKSGYGFECNFNENIFNIDGYNADSKNYATEIQYRYALFPEFNYEYGADTCRYIEPDIEADVNTFVNAGGMQKQHFTPIYYPDGDYKFKIVLSDCWTPAGMLKTHKNVTINIDGSMYDDWYVKH